MKKPKCEILYKKNKYYHIYNRGHHKSPIYRCKKDYLNFIRLMERYLDRYDIVLISYCLMPNHYHLVLKLGESKMDISKFMQRFMTAYSCYFNRKYGLIGTVFQNRFEARRLDDYIDLFNMIEYLKNNPLEAGITSIKKRYRWLYIKKKILKVGPRPGLWKRKV